ncbi:MAG: RHS repeat-associated core domain-containing protein [Bacillales bacterium]|nr:RHS repeat-associated core domain-containing protein [Bacillales bacterium]
MIQKITNNTINPGITIVDSKIYGTNGTLYSYSSSGHYYSGFNSTKLMFIKLTFNILSSSDIQRSYLNLKYSGVHNSTMLRIYDTNQTATTSAALLSVISNYSNTAYFDDAVIIDESTMTDGYGRASFDITNIIRSKATSTTFSVVLMIASDYSSATELKLYDPVYDTDDVCVTTLSAIDGLSSNYQYQESDAGFAGKTYVNLATGKMLLNFAGPSSKDTKMPLAFGFTYNSNRYQLSYDLGNGAKSFFNYKIYQSGSSLIVQDPSGYDNVFTPIDDEEAENLDIDTSNQSCDYYYSYETGSHIAYNSSTSLLRLYDKNENLMSFYYNTIVTRLMSISNKLGKTTDYNWDILNGNPPESIENSVGEIMSLVYDSSDRVVTATCNSIILTFAYDASGRLSSVIENNGSTNLYTATYGYDTNGYMNDIHDSYSDTGISFTYTGGKVTRIDYYKNSTTESAGYKVIAYNDNFTSVANEKGEINYYYFNENGKCIMVMDDKGKTISFNYDEIKNGLSSNLSGQSHVQHNSRNLIENNSFESNDDLFGDDSCWTISGASSTTAETVDDGVYGQKSLKVSHAAGETITISQNLHNVYEGTYILKGFLKRYTQASAITSSNIKIKLIGSYDITESVPVTTTQSDGTTVTTYVNQTNHCDNLSVENASFSGDSNWVAFSLPALSFPTASFNNTLNITIQLIGNTYDVYFDELQLNSKDMSARYNYVENGYMEYGSVLPTGFAMNSVGLLDSIYTLTSSDEHASILGKKVMRLYETCAYTQTSGTINSKKFYREIPIKGIEGEELVFSIFAKALATENNIFRAYIIFNYVGQSAVSTYRFDFIKDFSNWQMLTKSITAEHSYDGIILGVEYAGKSNAYIDAFQLYKDNYGKYYSYDKKGNLINTVDGASSSSFSYNDLNEIESASLSDGSYYRYEYDDDRQITGVYDSNGNHLVMEYDDNGNRTSVQLFDVNGKALNVSSAYNSYSKALSYTNELNETTTYSFDAKGLLQTTTDPTGQVERNSYDSYDRLICLDSFHGGNAPTNAENQYSYNSLNQLASISSNNGTTYGFVYDDFGRITEINIDGARYQSKEYNLSHGTPSVNTGLLTMKRYGTSGDYYAFTYDDNDRIATVLLNGNQIAAYEYDENGQISKSTDSVNDNTRNFSYDLKGNLKKSTDSDGNSISYFYDNLGAVQKTIYEINEKNRTFDYQYTYEENEYSKEGYFERLSTVYGDEIIKGNMLGKGTYGATPDEDIPSSMVYTDDVIKMSVYKFSTADNKIEYELSKFNNDRDGIYYNSTQFNYNVWKSNFANEKTFYAWIKPMGSFSEECIFQFADITNQTTYCSLVVNSTGHLGLKPYNSSSMALTSSALTIGVYNLVGVQFIKSSSSITARLIVNGNVTEFSTTIDPSNFGYLKVADQREYNYSSLLPMYIYIAFMSAGSYPYTADDFQAIYKAGAPYLSSIINRESKTSGVLYYNKTPYESFDIITLNGSFVSSKGLEPKTIVETDNSYKVDKAKLFKYDLTLKKHIYGSYSSVVNLTPGNNSKLVYDLGLGASGTISIRYRFDASASQDTYPKMLFSFINGSTTHLYAEYQSSTGFKIYDNAGHSTVIPFDTGVWHTLSLSYNSSGTLLYQDLTSISNSLSINLTGCEAYIGSGSSDNTQMDGDMEMLVFGNSKATATQLQAFYSGRKSYSVLKTHDLLDRITKKEIIKNSATASHTTTTYYTHGDTTTAIHPLVHSEETTTKEQNVSTTEVTIYSYDSLNNVTSKLVTDANGVGKERVDYSYDEIGRLSEEDTYTYVSGTGLVLTYKFKYTYDQNGNITYRKKYSSTDSLLATKSYVYDQTIKDRLASVTDGNTTTTITYGTGFAFNPTYIGSTPLAWSGRRLTGYGSNLFVYNEDGIRIRKTSVGFATHTYDLEGKRVVGETIDSPSIHFDYNYDEEGTLIGLTYNGIEYFYLRDITGNIVKIVDESGNTVVKYSYDAWGTVTKTNIANTTASGILYTYNPYLYKGYYYDRETNLYYCNSRYYSPSLCRWISADAIDNLDQSTIDGINLYAYCGNNPVMGYDPEGKWNWKKFAIALAVSIVIVAVTVAIVVATTATGGLAMLIIGAAVTTGVVLSYAAGAEKTVVIDLSCYLWDVGGGNSLVIDFKNDSCELYSHGGFVMGDSPMAISFSVGLVDNYKGKRGYEGPFMKIGGGYKIGIEHAFDPTKPYDETVRATTVTFSNSFGVYAGFDYYTSLFYFNF